MDKKIPHNYLEAFKRLELRETSKVKYFFKYRLLPYLSAFCKVDIGSALLNQSFDLFYAEYSTRNLHVNELDFTDESEYNEAFELNMEICALLAYWHDRRHKADRVKDDQMLIRLIKIRHKL